MVAVRASTFFFESVLFVAHVLKIMNNNYRNKEIDFIINLNLNGHIMVEIFCFFFRVHRYQSRLKVSLF